MTTRSAPLMMNVPFLVIFGMSPKKIVCSLISSVSLIFNSIVTCKGTLYVTSRSRHSSSVNSGSRISCSVRLISYFGLSEE